MDSNPFANDIVPDLFSGGAERDRPVFHSRAFDRLALALEELNGAPSGRLLLLTAPRAGFGKTHVLDRVRRRFAESHLVLPLQFDRDREVTWERLFAVGITDADRSLAPGVGTHGLLEEIARHFFARLTANLIRSGEIPCPEPEEALESLDRHPSEVFDFSREDSPVMTWFCSVFEALLPSLSAEASRVFGISTEEASFWAVSLFNYSCERAAPSGVDDDLARLEPFLRTGDDVSESVEMIFRERFAGWGRIAGGYRPVILVADHLDGVFGDSEKGLDTACVLLELPGLIPGSLTVLSANLDLWTSIFDGNLPGAIEDRLTAEVIALEGVSLEEGQQLIDYRLGASGIPDDVKFRFLPRLGLEGLFEASLPGRPSPRAVLRLARERWDRFAGVGYGLEEPVAAPPETTAPLAEPMRAPAESLPIPAVSEHPPVERPSVEFVSLTEEEPPAADVKSPGLAPLHFDRPMTLTQPSMQENAVPPPAEEVPAPISSEPWKLPEPNLSDLPDFGGFTMPSMEPAAKETPAVPPEPASPVSSPAPPTEPAQVPANPIEDAEPAVPTLEDAVGDLMEEAKKAFSGFREIFQTDGVETGAETESAAPVTPESSPEVAAEPLFEPQGLTSDLGGEKKLAPPEEVSSPESGGIDFSALEALVREAAERNDTSTPEPATEPAPAAPQREVASSSSGSLPTRFHQLRSKLMAEPASKGVVDPLEFYAVVRAAGEQSPVVSQSEFDLPERSGYRVVGWSYDSHDILFGFFPVENVNYWRALVAYALELGGKNGAQPGKGRQVKVVALSPSGRVLDVSSWEPGRHVPAERRPLIDAVPVDPETAAAVSAAAHLLREATSGETGQALPELHTFLTRELDYFWRRLTRPMERQGSIKG